MEPSDQSPLRDRQLHHNVLHQQAVQDPFLDPVAACHRAVGLVGSALLNLNGSSPAGDAQRSGIA